MYTYELDHGKDELQFDIFEISDLFINAGSRNPGSPLSNISSSIPANLENISLDNANESSETLTLFPDYIEDKIDKCLFDL